MAKFRISQRITAEDTTSHTSDILGNPTNASNDGLTYYLDNEDRIVDVNDISGDVAAYEYDRLGRRNSKTVGTDETHFVYDTMGNIIAEYEEDGTTDTWKKDYVYGAKGEAVYMQIPQTTEMNDAFDNFVGFLEAWLCDPSCTAADLEWDYDDSNDIDLIDWAYAVVGEVLLVTARTGHTPIYSAKRGATTYRGHCRGYGFFMGP